MEVPKQIEIPVDIDNEASILSNAIKSNGNRELFSKMCNYLDFRMKENQTLAWTINELYENNLTPDIDTILVKAKSSPIRYSIDYEYINAVINNYNELPDDNFRLHIQQLKTDKVREDLTNFYFSSIYTACLNPQVQMPFLEERINYAKDIITKNFSFNSSQFQTMNEVITSFEQKKQEKTDFKSTGFAALDELLTEGYKPKGLTVLCGRPGEGKSSLVLSSMYNLSHIGTWCPQFALEMDSMGLATKLVAFASKISVKRIAKEWDNLREPEKKLIESELFRLKNNKYIYINDKPSQSLKTVREQIMILQDRLKTEYMWATIDLFGKIREFQESENFARDYEKKLNTTQGMAKELGVNLGLVAQINREVNKRKWNRPKMSDLKNAGAWEEVADLILGVHRPNYDPEKAMKEAAEAGASFGFNYDDENGDDYSFDNVTPLEESAAEVIILKQRMGKGNEICHFIFDPETTRYVPVAQKDQYYVSLAKQQLLESAV